MTKEEVEKIIANSKAPKAVLVQSAKGQLYFISDENAKGMAAPSSVQRLGSALLNKIGTKGGGATALYTRESCDRIADWLTSSVPDKEGVWEGVAREYLAKC
jgi:hypothetical protein